MKKILTLCIIHKENKILLGMKKRGFGVGFWNGFGGKVEENETIEEAVIREVKEEAGIKIFNIKKRGILNFEIENDSELLEVHIFGSSEFNGEPKETEEMKPKWFESNKLPFDKMWPDDSYWMPLFVKNKSFKGYFLFKDNNTIIRHSLQEI